MFSVKFGAAMIPDTMKPGYAAACCQLCMCAVLNSPANFPLVQKRFLQISEILLWRLFTVNAMKYDRLYQIYQRLLSQKSMRASNSSFQE